MINMTHKTLSVIALATATALVGAGCQHRQSTRATPAEEKPLATAADAQPTPPGDATAAVPAPTTDNPTAPTPAPVTPDVNKGAPRNPVASGTPSAGVPAAATGPVAPATAPVTTGPVERGGRIYVAADADDATVIRNYPVSVNYVPSGHALAGPVYRITPPPARSGRWDDQYATDLFQTVLTVPQMFATPFWMIATPPWTPVEYHGEQFPPSYTANDPLPYYVDEKVPGMVQMKR